jgi:TctA family transporter
MQKNQKKSLVKLLENEDGFVWATPTMLGLLLLSTSMGRFLFWLPTLEGARQIPVSSHLASLFALPFGIAALMILAAKKRHPGPDWQHSHWQFHLRTLVIGAVGGCAVALVYFPAVTQSAMSVQRLLVGGALLISVSLLVLVRTLRAIRASERKLPIGA